MVWPGVQALLAVPLAAHALFNRPIVVGPTSVLTVEILPQSGGSACCGVMAVAVRNFRWVPLSRFDVDLPLRLARIDEAVFTDRLVNKFHLPVSGWRGEQGVLR